METNIVLADSNNLTQVESVMIALFYTNNADFFAADVKNVTDMWVPYEATSFQNLFKSYSGKYYRMSFV